MRVVMAGLVVVSVLSSSAAFAAMDKTQRATFEDKCVRQMYMTTAQCSCMADIAEKKLDDLSIAYLSLDALDVRNAAAISKKLTAAESGAINRFMSTAPGQCKGAK